MNRPGTFKVKLPRIMSGAEANALTKGESSYPKSASVRHVYREENYYSDGSTRWGYTSGNDDFFKDHRFEEISFNRAFGKSFKDE